MGSYDVVEVTSAVCLEASHLIPPSVSICQRGIDHYILQGVLVVLHEVTCI